MRVAYFEERWSWRWKAEGRRPVGRAKKTWSKVVKVDIRKLNIIEDMAEDKKQWRQLIVEAFSRRRFKFYFHLFQTHYNNKI